MTSYEARSGGERSERADVYTAVSNCPRCELNRSIRVRWRLGELGLSIPEDDQSLRHPLLLLQ